MRGWTIAPGEALMPEEVMDHRGFDGEGRGQQIVEVQPGAEEGERDELDDDSDSAYEIEL